jgi:hypothetical protein
LIWFFWLTDGHWHLMTTATRLPVFRCRHCRQIKTKRTPEQKYCGSAVCQRARKNAWRRDKYESDPDHRANARDSTDAWLEANGGCAAYFRDYRAGKRRRSPRRPGNPPKLRPRAGDVEPAVAANSDAKLTEFAVNPGMYRLVPLESANSDAILVELTVISRL